MKHLDLKDIEVYGELDERIQRNILSLLERRFNIFDEFGEGYGTSYWGGDFIGRWLETMSMALQYKKQFDGNVFNVVREVAEKLVAVQNPSGNLFSFVAPTILKGDGFDWGNGRAMNGAIEYYKLLGDERFLTFAKRIGDFYYENYLNIKKEFSPTYYASSGVLEKGIVELWNITHDERYLKVAEEIANPIQPSVLGHTHSYLTTINGLFDLYEATGKKEYLNLVFEGWRQTRKLMWVTGGIPGSMTKLYFEGDEACAISDWIRLNLKLLRLTHEVKYADLAERTLLNQLYFDQHRGGGFRYPGVIHQAFGSPFEAFYCCSMNGGKGFLEFVKNVYTFNDKVIWVNFFLDSKANIQLTRDLNVTVTQKTDYPRTGFAELTVLTENKSPFEIRVRIPEWTKLAGVYLNGKESDYLLKENYAIVKRSWNSGDRLTITFPLRLWVELDNSLGGDKCKGNKVVLNREERNARRIAFLYGSVVIAIFRIRHGNDLSWIYAGDYPEILDAGGEHDKIGNSASDFLRFQDSSFETAKRAKTTEIVNSGYAVPSVRWIHEFGSDARHHGYVQYDVKIMPYIPLTMECVETVKIDQHDGGVKELLLSGLRLAKKKEFTLKWARNAKLVKTYYEQSTLPGVPTIKEGDGNYSIDNSWCKIICFYKCDTEKIKPKVLNEEEYFGVYLSPTLNSAQEKTLTDFSMIREVIFLPKRMRLLAPEILKKGSMIEKASAKLLTIEGGEKSLELSGSPGKGKLIAILKVPGLEPGMLIWNNNCASYIYSYGSQLMMAVDVPGVYRVKPHERFHFGNTEK